MKKIYTGALIPLAALFVFSTSVMASDVYLKVGYNVAGMSDVTATRSYTADEEITTFYGGGGEGLVISAGLGYDVTENVNLKTSITLDYMNKTFHNGNSLGFSNDKFVPLPTEDNVSLNVNKWSISADLLGEYNLVKNSKYIRAGALLGANFVYTNAYDIWVPTSVYQDELDYYKDFEEYVDETCFEYDDKLDGIGLVAGAFIDCALNEKIDVSAKGYIGIVNFGDLENGLTNYKLSADMSYEVCNDVDVIGSFTLANAKFNKNNYHCECNAPDFISNDYIVYNYKQFIPSISLSYKF